MISALHKTRSRREELPSEPKPERTRKQTHILVHAQYTQYAVIARMSKRMRWQLCAKEEQREDEGGPGLYPVVRRAESSDWSVMWADSGLYAEKHLRACKPFQRINHFPGMVHIYRKSNLARSMARMQRLQPDAYDYFPRSWVLPEAAPEVARYLAGASSPRGDGLAGGGKDDQGACILCAVCCVLCAVCCVPCAVCRVLCAVCCPATAGLLHVPAD